MKKLLFALATVMLFVSGCGQSESIIPSFTQDDLNMTIDGAVYRCNINIQTVIGNLGEGYDYAEGMSCDYDGLDKTYTYEIATFYTNPLSEGDIVNEIYTKDASVSTSKGVTVGAAKSEVLAAYGEGCEDEGDRLIYRLPDERVKLCFEMDKDDVVWAIYLTTQAI